MAESVQAQGIWGRFVASVHNRKEFSIWFAAAVVVAGLLIPSSQLSIIVAGVGAFIGVCLFALFRMKHNSQQPAHSQSIVDRVISNDPKAILIADASGDVIFQNHAASTLFSQKVLSISNQEVGNLEKVIQSVFANAGAVVFRLQAKAERLDHADEVVVTRSGRYRVHVHKIDSESYFWSFDALRDEGQTGHGADRLSLPMFTVGNSGAVLYMNAATRRLLGSRVKSLDAIFSDSKLQSGDVTEVLTQDGPTKVRVCIVEATAGRSEYFLCPVGVEENSRNIANNLEDFPVALLEIAPNGQVVEFNDLAASLLRIDKNVGPLTELVEGLGRPLEEWLSNAMDGRQLHQPEVLRVCNVTEEKYVQVSLGRIIHDGKVTLIALISDATELKSLEAQFVQSQKMQAIGQLAGGVAHDFNNLLTAISGHCDLLMLRHDRGDEDFADLEQISQNANRAASLVGQLLAFSRKQNLQMEVLDMHDTLADLAHLLNRLVGAQISLTLTHDPNLMSVRADRRQLEQVLMNLVVNARDALDGAGEIALETRNFRLEEDLKRDRAVVPKGDYVLIKVCDNGCGIPEDRLAKIFEPFFTTKRTGEGTGLGLSTAYGIVKQTDGFIFVDSEVGKGTTFTIFIPTSDRPIRQIEATVDFEPQLPNSAVDGVILLVEDEAPVRAFASRALQHSGFRVLEAENAEQALFLLNQEDNIIDVIVTDVIMPGLDGPTWVSQARQTQPDLKVVFMSGYADGSLVQDQLALPNSVFLPKPFSLSELTATVHKHMVAA